MDIAAAPSIFEPYQDKTRDLFIGVVVTILIFIMAARMPVDQDIWWHLKSGQATLQMGHPLTADIFSFTKAGESWTNHSWLAQVGLFLLYQMGHFYALTLFVAFMAAISFVLIFLQMNGPVLVKAFALILGAIVASSAWVARPELFSFLFTAAVSSILFRFKWKKVDQIWWLVPIMAVWSNLHGGYVIGFILILCMLTGEIINHLLGFRNDVTLPYPKIFKLLLILGVSSLAVLINPNGINTWLIPFQTVSVGALQKFIEEWASPDFHLLSQQPFIWMVLGCLAAIGLSGKTLDATDLVSLAIFSYMGLVSRRNVGLFALVASPILVRYIWPAITNWLDRIRHTWLPALSRSTFSRKLMSGQLDQKPKFGKLINLGVVALLSVAAISKVYIASEPELVYASEQKTFPVAAVDWIKSNRPQGQILNSYNWGGYLIWNLPEYPVFLDGRTDLFSDVIISQWFNVVNAEGGWQQILDKWDIHLILLEPYWTIVKILPDNGWKILYQDDTAVIFGR
jgi:hypothetical protein